MSCEVDSLLSLLYFPHTGYELCSRKLRDRTTQCCLPLICYLTLYCMYLVLWDLSIYPSIYLLPAIADNSYCMLLLLSKPVDKDHETSLFQSIYIHINSSSLSGSSSQTAGCSTPPQAQTLNNNNPHERSCLSLRLVCTSAY